MAKRGYKLQEFVAHPGSVNSLSIGKKTCRLFVTGGDDHKVNLWSIGKPASLMSLCGHTSSVESVAFDSEEVLVAAGASAGVIKLWDLEETKMVRGLTGHRSSCTAVEFHPFGEFFASGSMDSNLKIWDIRKKGCIHTYKGHTRGISTIRFTPDGRWVVSGGYDNVVKVWDLTAGKLMHDFKYHEGHIRSMDFHPLEFLLATGSADGTVKFWDLETFELIGSTRPEATGVKSISFHPDGRTLFSGFDDGLKVYSWEPVICHDAVDMGWSALSDLCIHDGKLLGFSYYRNSVGVWVADVSRIEPYGAGLVTDEDSYLEKKSNLQDSPLEKVRSHRRSTSNLRSMSPDYETKEIKNIYVDTTGETTVASKKVGSFNTPKVVHSSDSKESGILASQKQRSAAGLHAHAKTIGQGNTKSFTAPIVLPRKSPDRKDTVISRRESIIAGKAASGIPLKPSHTRRPSNTKFEMDRESMAVESCSLQSAGSVLDTMDPNFRSRLVENDDARESSNDKHLNISSVTQKFETTLSPRTPSNHNRDESLDCSKEVDSVKVVRGVTIVTGRTRSLVERFEGRKRSESDEIQTPAPAPAPVTVSEAAKTPPTPDSHPLVAGRETVAANDSKIAEEIMQNHDVFLSTLRSRLTKLQVVRHFWERSDIKGAVESMRKLPDNSLQADVVSILMERMEILNLDLFLCLLPVLLGLLNGEIERHANVSLEMLLKLVAVFGPVVHSTISAPPAIGVNLQAEQRLECCNRCFSYLQKIQNILPAI